MLFTKYPQWEVTEENMESRTRGYAYFALYLTFYELKTNYIHTQHIPVAHILTLLMCVNTVMPDTKCAQ